MQQTINVCVSVNHRQQQVQASFQTGLLCSQRMKSHNKNVKDKIKARHGEEYWWMGTEQSLWLKWPLYTSSWKVRQTTTKRCKTWHKISTETKQPQRDSKCNETQDDYKVMQKDCREMTGRRCKTRWPQNNDHKENKTTIKRHKMRTQRDAERLWRDLKWLWRNTKQPQRQLRRRRLVICLDKEQLL